MTGQLAGLSAQVITGAVFYAGMTVGTYYATNTVISPEATNSPRLVSVLLTVDKGSQAITFPNPGNQVAANTVGLIATASSGQPVTFTVTNGPGIISGITNLTFMGSGAVGIVASQGGDANWNPAPDVTHTINVDITGQDELTFAPASPQVYNTTQGLSATGGSGGGALTFAVASGSGTISGGTNLLMTAGTGTVNVVATKAADAIYAPASVTAQVAAAKADQAIAFPAIPNQLATATVGLSATAGSGLPVAFAVGSGPATITGGTNLSFTGARTVSVVASQGGDGNWNPAPNQTNMFTVTKAPATVTLQNLAQPYNGTPRVVAAVPTPAGLPVAITYNGSATAPVNAGNYTVVGTVNHAKYQGGKTGTLAVAKASQVIAFPAIPDQVTTSVVMLAATASSGLPVTFTKRSGPGTITGGNKLSFTATGTVTVAANQAGNANWKAAATVLRTMKVNPARPMVVGMLKDFDGDGKADYGVYQETTGTWQIKLSSGGYFLLTLTKFLGGTGKVAMAGDFDGDGLSDPAVYQRSDGTWQILLSGAGYMPILLPHFLGGPGWEPVPGDYDGDGLADPAVRKSDGSVWRMMLSGSGYAPIEVPLGL